MLRSGTESVGRPSVMGWITLLVRWLCRGAIYTRAVTSRRQPTSTPAWRYGTATVGRRWPRGSTSPYTRSLYRVVIYMRVVFSRRGMVVSGIALPDGMGVVGQHL